jgi:uncharacterized sulfatase
MSSSAGDPPNVVWITLDSIRQDRTTLGGHERNTTPNLESIADRPTGVSFDECIAAGNWSLPSAASILTGTFPEHHRTGFETDRLPDHVNTVAERLRDAGYHTIGISANHYFSEATGLDRGFDEFTHVNPADFFTQAGLGTTLKFLCNLRSHSGGFSATKTKHRPDYVINEMVKDELTARVDDEQSFFLTAHYHGAHVPYYPPPTRQDRFADSTSVDVGAASETAFHHTADLHRAMAAADAFDEDDWEALDVMYDTLVAYCDDLMGDLFKHMESLDLDDTIFVVTADHGDLLGEYDLLGHKFVLHDGLVRVPAVVHGTDVLCDVDQDLVQHQDLIMTLVAFAGGETDGMQGRDLRTEEREYAISQRGPGVEDGLDEIREYDENYEAPQVQHGVLTALRTSEYKFQQSDEGAKLFALPDEQTDVSEQQSAKANRFDDVLAKRRAAIAGPSVDDQDAEFTDEMKDQLADLGYLTD